MSYKRQIRISLAIILSFGALLTVVFAWFPSENNQTKNMQINVTDIDNQVTAKLFLGNDYDKNGSLDAWYNASGEVITDENVYTREEIIHGKYSEIASITDSVFLGLYGGNILTFDVVITNSESRPVVIDLYFDYTPNNKNTAMMYSLRNIEAVSYSTDAFTSSRPSGDPTNHSLGMIKEYNLYELDYQFEFVRNITLPANSTLEVRYELECLSNNRAYEFYDDYYRSYYENYYLRYLSKMLADEAINFTNIISLFDLNNGLDTVANNQIVLNNAIEALQNSLVNDGLSNTSLLYTRLNTLKNINLADIEADRMAIRTQIDDIIITGITLFTIDSLNIRVTHMTGDEQ